MRLKYYTYICLNKIKQNTMKTNSLILNVFAVIMAFGMTLSTLGIITSTSVETLEFSLFNFFAWFIGGLVVIFIYIKYFEK